MNMLDVRTILFSSIITSAICAMVITSLWRQNRRRSPELGYWLADFILQFLAILLIALRGVLPDVASVLLGVPFILSGALLMLIGLERYVGKTSAQRHNFILLAGFILVHAYFTFGQPNLTTRTINLSLGLLAICTQCAWLLLGRVDVPARPETRAVGVIFAGYGLISVLRIYVDLVTPRNNDLFTSGLYDALAILIYQILLIGLAFTLSLMVSRRLYAALENDITERKRAEETLRQSEEKYRALFQNAQVGMYRSKLDGSAILAVNQKLCKIFGYVEEEMIENPATIRWADPVARERMVTDLRKTGSLHDYELDILTKSEQVRTCSVSIQLYPDRGYIEGSAIDITERRRVEVALRESERRFRELAESLPQLVWTCLPDGPCDYLNRQWLEYTGIPEAEQLGYGWLKQLNPDDREQTIAKWSASVVRGAAFDIEFRIRRADGVYRWFATRAIPLRDDDGTVTKWFGSNTDIDDRKRAEKEILALNEKLEQRVVERTAQLQAANRELEAFAYSVSHDLRSPLRAINGFSHIIVEDHGDKLDAEGKRLLNIVSTNAQKMDQLITELLALSRVTLGEMQFSRVDMTTLAQSIYDEIAASQGQPAFTFSVAPLPDVFGDPILLRQVWSNLISNAIKYTMPKEARRTEIGGYGEKGMNTYFVKDNGVGFNPDYAHKLFGVFQRLHKVEEFGGIGVGLAIVQRIVHRHGGRVWAEGQVNQGATFYFALPQKEIAHEPS